MTGFSEFLTPGGIVPALSVAVLSFLLGTALLAFSEICVAIAEIATNTRGLFSPPRHGPSYVALRTVARLALIVSILSFIGGAIATIALLIR